MDAISIANLLLSLFVLTISICCVLFVFANSKKQKMTMDGVAELRKYLEENAKEQAEALTALAKLVSTEAQDNFEAIKKMQQYNEEVFEKFAEDLRKNYEGISFIQSFLNKLAEGLGFRTRSNLDDL